MIFGLVGYVFPVSCADYTTTQHVQIVEVYYENALIVIDKQLFVAQTRWYEPYRLLVNKTMLYATLPMKPTLKRKILIFTISKCGGNVSCPPKSCDLTVLKVNSLVWGYIVRRVIH